MIHLHCRWCLGIGSAQFLNWNGRRAARTALRVALLCRDGVRLRFLGVGRRLIVRVVVVTFAKECRQALGITFNSYIGLGAIRVRGAQRLANKKSGA